MSKKYYWLKLKDDFFERDEIKVIESQKNGPSYINFYLKLLLKSLKSEGTLRFREAIPYNLEMLATITNCNVDMVSNAITTFISLGLMEKWDDGTFFMLEVKNMVGAETSWAEKKREYRNRKKTLSSNCPDIFMTKTRHVRQDIEIDKEKWDELNEKLLNHTVIKDKQKKRSIELSLQTKENQVLI
ncbi:phage replisome organizer N-terminal domain-containing protein [Aliarcobacter skirrowii]|uniref:phage replisome organizer N-terminal domain-containing protein n=1 Tax=Aliarcobacter skirrowii TaxID=28200 RepID=UPI0008246631|nr:phage replisome organizer N-terminal domain-containing protein [Aliarcobacter skirrowii]